MAESLPPLPPANLWQRNCASELLHSRKHMSRMALVRFWSKNVLDRQITRFRRLVKRMSKYPRRRTRRTWALGLDGGLKVREKSFVTP